MSATASAAIALLGLAVFAALAFYIVDLNRSHGPEWIVRLIERLWP